MLKHKILKLALDFSLFQNEKRLYDEKKARGDLGKKPGSKKRTSLKLKVERLKVIMRKEERYGMPSAKHINTEEIKK